MEAQQPPAKRGMIYIESRKCIGCKAEILIYWAPLKKKYLSYTAADPEIPHWTECRHAFKNKPLSKSLGIIGHRDPMGPGYRGTF